MRQNLVTNYVIHTKKREKVMCQCAKKTTDRRARARRFGKVVKSEIGQKG